MEKTSEGIQARWDSFSKEKREAMGRIRALIEEDGKKISLTELMDACEWMKGK